MSKADVVKEFLTAGGTWRDGSNLWGALCRMCAEQRISTVQEFVRAVAILESDLRRKSGESVLPGKYRSAKSVIRTAIKLRVPFVEANGDPRGKTAVEKDCRAQRGL